MCYESVPRAETAVWAARRNFRSSSPLEGESLPTFCGAEHLTTDCLRPLFCNTLSRAICKELLCVDPCNQFAGLFIAAIQETSLYLKKSERVGLTEHLLVAVVYDRPKEFAAASWQTWSVSGAASVVCAAADLKLCADRPLAQ